MSEKIVDSGETVDSKKPENYFFRASAEDFKKIPSSPIAYWVSEKVFNLFESAIALGDVAKPMIGMRTGENDKYIRRWFEVGNKKSEYDATSAAYGVLSGKRWFPYQKGGGFRRWYGNLDFVVNWYNDGVEIKENTLKNYPQLSLDNLGWKISNEKFYFKQGITWTATSSSYFGVRFADKGCLFDVKGSFCIPNDSEVNLVLGLLCSNFTQGIVKVLNPTIEVQPRDIASIPYNKSELESCGDRIKEVVSCLVRGAKSDWNSYESAWDFTSLPLIQSDFRQATLKETYQKLRLHWFNMTMKMQQLEEENNRIFIKAYGLQDELTPDVPLKEITLTCNPFYRYGKTAVKSEECEVGGGTVESDECEVRSKNSPLSTSHFPLNRELEERLLADTMKEFISYAVGCMFGRYSLDKEGLILANQGETLADYYKTVGSDECEVRSDEQVRSEKWKVKSKSSSLPTSHFPLSTERSPLPTSHSPLSTERSPLPTSHFPLGEAHPPLSFAPDDDNVIPILDGEWFTDDVTERFRRFVKVTFGDEHYQENLAFIEQSIGKDIRKYFLKDFYADHVKRYKKRPIYWMFSSPKGSFNALIYMHRYQPTTASVVLNDYLREFRTKLIARKDHLEQVSISASVSQRDKTQALKEIEKLKKMIDELESWERDVLYPLAAEQIEIDFDDGVKVNYPKFGKALKKVVGLS